ncbi:MAG TPA: MraY family glycosyltransferase [Phycisphaerae bacterium]|nr:MraY family glycosyltransferase [Phycisphaerae bacterium]
MLASFLPDTHVDDWTLLQGIWGPHVWILTGAMVLSLVLTPVFRTIALRYKVYDMPDERLKTHKRPIPYLGGIAIFLAWAIPVFVVALIQTLWPGNVPAETAEAIRQAGRDVPERWIQNPESLFWVLGGGLLMMVLGVIDDTRNLSPKAKIVGQVAAAGMLIAGGMTFRALPTCMPSDMGGFALFPADAWWVLALGIAFQVVLVVGASNATNLLDGLDGLCSGVTAFISAGFLLLATSLMAWDLYGPTGTPYVNSEPIVLLSFALLGAVIGFLPYNFNPASIFMGDAGSMFLGYMAAVFMILFAEKPVGFKWFLGAMVIFGLPIFDTGLALIRRLVNRRPIFAGDRSHFYDQLVDRGCSVKTSVLINYGLSAVFGLIGVGIIFLELRYALPIYLVIFAGIAAAVFKLGLVRVDRSSSPTVADGAATDGESQTRSG